MSIRFEAQIRTEKSYFLFQRAGGQSRQSQHSLPRKSPEMKITPFIVVLYLGQVFQYHLCMTSRPQNSTPALSDTNPKGRRGRNQNFPWGATRLTLPRADLPWGSFSGEPLLWLLKLSPKLRVLMSPNAAAIQLLQVIFQISLPFNSRYQGRQGCKIKN